MELFPTFLRLNGRPVLVVGGGPVAASKLAALVAAGAAVTVVSPDVCAAVRDAGVAVRRREFTESDLDGVWFVVAAATPDVNARVARAADARQLFVNAVDDPPNASAYLGGVVRRSGVTLAISTDGNAPALAGLLREAVDAMLPADLDRWMGTARKIRKTWKANGTPMQERRPQLLTALVQLYSPAPCERSEAPAAASEGRRERPRSGGPSAQRAWGSPGAPCERSDQR
jgi:uroporphyrin-III C-methyltransferase/precorrin-2 dehydrogenase/sirohydrochlorin ferrochelatase